jgi:sugar lactone lactonase YvrE
VKTADRWPGTAAAIIALAACGGDGSEQAGPPLELELVEVARIDGEDAVGGGGFGRIVALEIGSDGTVYVADALNRVVHAFDGRGSTQRVFGGRGGGPGELEEPTAMFLGADGHLWVVDAGNARYTVFDAAGGLVGTYRGPDPSVFYPLAVGLAGGVVRTVALEFGRLEQPSALLVEHAPSGGGGGGGEVRRTGLPLAPLSPAFEHRGGGAMIMIPIPFGPEPAFQIDGQGRLWYASGADPWVQRVSPDGAVAQQYGRDFEAQPVTRADREAALEDPDVAELRAAAGAAGIEELTARIPERKPHLRGFFVDDEGRVWIMPTQGRDAGPAAATVELYAPDGTPLGVARVAVEPEPRPRVRGGLLAGVVRDELGVESVVLYRMPTDAPPRVSP